MSNNNPNLPAESIEGKAIYAETVVGSGTKIGGQPPIRPRRVPRVVAVVVAVTVLGSVFYGIISWRDSRAAAAAAASAWEAAPVQVSAVELAYENLPLNIATVGSLKAADEIVLAPEVGGRISQLNLESGETIAAGTLLVSIDDKTEQAELLSAQARARYAELQLERSQRLAQSGTESGQALQQREVEAEQARAEVAMVEARIAQKTIIAPFDGVLGLRQVAQGAFVNAGQVIATLTAIDELHVDFRVPQRDLPKLSVGAPVNIRTDVFPDRDFTAIVSAIDPVIAADTRNVTVQATLDNSDGSLRPGMFANVSLALEAKPETIVVPGTAIQQSASGDMAYLIREGVAAIVPVTVGTRLDGRVEITSGLELGDVLITEGQTRVDPGAAVVIADPNAPAAETAW
ncbi:MAG: efflux RND transporter periplasmic adaptor subunit [Candidatus Devosia phytovorans]|uniref:Efflux RND transporter periplasmic adaptor subunit n=1 Tax=Candidatus Devosia phytovorans TaxID=3121372 RepID=A0AAJ5VV95_9HYPH|nr:efflux RND transporter periplasmic adaptor subunit [Devosia sp.]WEK04726.1 MAG: efflux RND transporter periplasmic adaptor subunit [Devosia sp.]